MGVEITELLQRVGEGEQAALDDVFHALYPELQRLAAARIRDQRGGTLSPTVLVHELYEKISRSAAFNARDRAHFFGCAAHAMRQIVIDHARAKATEKRGGGLYEVTFDDARFAATPADAMRLDEALRRLEEIDPAFLELVELRFFTGLSMEQIAETTGVSVRTLQRRWRLARSALQALLDDPPDTGAVT